MQTAAYITDALGFGLEDDRNPEINEIKRFQTFLTPHTTASSAMFNLNGVRLMLKRINDNDPSDVIVELYATQNLQPTGHPKATAVVPSAHIGFTWTRNTSYWNLNLHVLVHNTSCKQLQRGGMDAERTISHELQNRGLTIREVKEKLLDIQ